MQDDPEQQRVIELLVRQRQGRIDEAEEVELALYRDERPELIRAAEPHAGEAERIATLGDGWLARVEADDALRKAETTPWTRFERAVALVLVGVGGITASVGIPLGLVAFLGGVAILLASMIRVRLARGHRDPYDDIQQ